MAAPSNDPSTNSQQRGAVDEVVAPPPPQLKPPPLPTYAGSEQSEHYQNAKLLLNAGEFEGALQLLEEGLECTKTALAHGQVTAIDLHESMAPFHYLYGTTLLYSVEESQDPQQAMMNNNSPATEEDSSPPDEEQHDPATMPVDSANNGAEPPSPAEDAQQQQLQDDMEIAWENLESARLILTAMLETPQSEQWNTKLRDDLAQVMLRIGDLQRWNGQYETAIQDYETALQYLNDAQVRKRAEIHSNLGAVYLNQVASAASATEEGKSSEDEPQKARLSPEQMEAARLKGFEHYYQCAVAFSTVIAELAGIPDWKPPMVSSTSTSEVRANLKALREIVQTWEVPEAANESVSLLDELQETVDEAETAETALQEATKLKEQITAAVAAQQDEPDEESNQTTNAFGASTAVVAQSTAVAQPMMVKKKKKAPENTDTLPPSKRPKNE